MLILSKVKAYGPGCRASALTVRLTAAKGSLRLRCRRFKALVMSSRSIENLESKLELPYVQSAAL